MEPEPGATEVLSSNDEGEFVRTFFDGGWDDAWVAAVVKPVRRGRAPSA